jgi:hypothetical protein
MPAAPDFGEQNAMFCAARQWPGCGSGAVPNVGCARSHRFTAHPFVQIPPFPANPTNLHSYAGRLVQRTHGSAAIRALDRAKWSWPDATPAECQLMNAVIRIETSSPGSSTPSLAT